MSVGHVIYARLTGNAGVSALVGTRVYPKRAPQEAAFPRITYRKVSTEEIESFDGPSALGVYRVQVELWAETYASLDALATAVKKRVADSGPLAGFAGTAGGTVCQACYRADEGDDEEPPEPADERGVYHASIDFELWIEE